LSYQSVAIPCSTARQIGYGCNPFIIHHHICTSLEKLLSPESWKLGKL